MKRPCTRFSITTTPRAAGAIDVFGGGIRQGSVALSDEEARSLRKLYGFTEATASSAADLFSAAGSNRDLIRYAETDGLRMVAVIARLCSPGDDPVAVMIELIARHHSGALDSEDVAWARGEFDADEEDVDE